MPRPVKTSLLRQLEMRECGATALGIILAYYGKHIALPELRTACGVTRDGVKVIGIVRAARHYGLNVRVFRRETLENLSPPFIIYWNFNHFLVVEAITSRGIRVNDPAFGRTYLSQTLVDRYFSGITLVFEPTAAFVAAGRPAPLIPAVMIQPLSLLYLATVTARGLVDLLWLAVIMNGLPPMWLLIGILYWAVWQWARHLLVHAYTTRTGSDLLRQVIHLPNAFFDRHYAHEIAARLLVLLGDLHAKTADRLAAVLRAAIYAGSLFVLSPWFAPALMLCPLRLIAAYHIERAAEQTEAERRVTRLRLQQTIFQGAHNLEAVRLQGGEAALLDQVRQAQTEIYSRTIDWERMARLAVDVLLMGMASVWLVLMIQAGIVSPLAALTGGGLLLLLIQPDYHDVLRGLREFRHQLARIDDLAGEVGHSTAADPIAQGIHLDHVSLTIDDTERLHDISIHVETGKSLGVLGRSGSGKTTLISVIAGFYPPTSGEIHINDAQIALIDGQPLIFEGTIADHLRVFDDTIPQAQIESAVQAVGLDARINALHDGFDTWLTPEKQPFSRGELQSLEIARALARDSKIMLLDEATSALDPLTEARLMDQLEGRTRVIVSHRLSTIRLCDEIIVMDNGRIIERGTHDSLIAAGELYMRLIAEQTLT